MTRHGYPSCPIATVVQILGGKWKLLIIRNLLIRPWRFNELKDDLIGISHKVLTDTLRVLEKDGLITRRTIETENQYQAYSLTELGESLRSLFANMKEWGTFYQNAMKQEK